MLLRHPIENKGVKYFILYLGQFDLLNGSGVRNFHCLRTKCRSRVEFRILELRDDVLGYWNEFMGHATGVKYLLLPHVLSSR